MQRFPTSLVCAGALLLGAAACSDDEDASSSDQPSPTIADNGPRTLAEVEDLQLIGDDGLAGQEIRISAEEDDGVVTGEFQIGPVITRVDYANTDTDGVVTIAGVVTTGDPTHIGVEGDLRALTIRFGDPDSIVLHGNDFGVETCDEYLEALAADSRLDDSDFVDVEAGSDIETG